MGTLHEQRPTEVPPQEVPEKCVLKTDRLCTALLSAVLPGTEVLREACFNRKRECLPNTKTL